MSEFFSRKLGSISKGNSGNMNFREQSLPDIFIYLYLFFLFIGFILFIFFIRLFQLTIVSGNYYSRLAQSNKTREIIIEPLRGLITDRKGILIANSIEANLSTRGERAYSLRQYEYPEAFAHVTGYRQVADKYDLINDLCLQKLRLGDKVGKKGVEKLFDCDLRGVAGKKLIEVDAVGNEVRVLGVVPAIAGKTIQLSIDAEIQKKAYDLIKSEKGAIIVSNPQNGEVLALASSPSYNPQSFEDERASDINRVLDDETHPLFNRALEGGYPVGSIFKLVVALAGLEENKITKASLFEDTGVIKAGEQVFGTWAYLKSGKKDGFINVVHALYRSNDIFFYHLGRSLGPELIQKWATQFGYGKKTGVGFDEIEGVIPFPYWKEQNLHEKWYLGDTYNLSIGQGYLLASPIQVAQVTNIFATSGLMCDLRLTKSGFSNDHEKAKNCRRLQLTKESVDLVREGMKKACETGGTGWPFFQYPVKTGCKTGTAESHAESGVPHAWFTVFAPFDNPKISVTVLIEEGGEGSDVAAPLALEIIKDYFQNAP